MPIRTETIHRRSAPRPTGSVGLSLKLAYPAAHFGKSIFWYSSESIFAYLLTEVVKLGPSAVGSILCASFLVSAALDVGVGLIIRRQLTSATSAGKLQLAGSVATSLSVILLFSIPAMKPATPLSMAAAAVFLFRITYAFIDIPQNAMLSLAIKTQQDRASLSASRLAASGLAALTVAATVAALVYSASDARPSLLVAASCAMAIMVIAVCSVLRIVIARTDMSAATDASVSSDERSFGLGRLALLLVTVQFVTSFASPVFTKLLPYYASVHLADPIRGVSVIALVSVGMIVGQPLWLAVLRDRTNPFKISTTCLATAAAAAFFCWVGQSGSLFLLAAACLFGMGSGGIGTTLWAAFADVIAEENRGSEGVAFGLFTAAAKVSLAIGVLGVGALLSEASVRQPGSSLLTLGMTLPSIAAGLVGGPAMLGWRRCATGRVSREELTE